MDELSRIIGSVETQLKGINIRMSEVEDKLDGLIADFNQRKGARKTMYAICGAMGAAGSVAASLLKGVFIHATNQN